MGISLYIGISVIEIPINSRETIPIFYGTVPNRNVPKESIFRSKDRKRFIVINVAFRHYFCALFINLRLTKRCTIDFDAKPFIGSGTVR